MATTDPEGDALIAALGDAEAAVRLHTFPPLEIRVMDERGNVTDRDPALALPDDCFLALWCPRCEQDVAPDRLCAVDSSIRWSYSDDPDFEGKKVTFWGGSNDYDDTLYYLHNDNHAVRLPDLWEETWQ